MDKQKPEWGADWDEDAKEWGEKLFNDLKIIKDGSPLTINLNYPQWLDQYQGPYCDFEMEPFGYFRTWTDDEGIFIEKFIIRNNIENQNDGFIGLSSEVVELLNDFSIQCKMVQYIFIRRRIQINK